MLKQGKIKARTVISTIRTMPQLTTTKKTFNISILFQAEITLTVSLNRQNDKKMNDE